MNLSSDLQTAFSDHLADKSIQLETDLSVQVLTTGFWPTYKSDDLNLPEQMLQCIETFKAFYDGRTNHRRLRWVIVHLWWTCPTSRVLSLPLDSRILSTTPQWQ